MTFEQKREQLGDDLQVSEDLFARFIEIQEKLKALGTLIQWNYGRPSGGFLDGSAKILATPDSNNFIDELKLLKEISELVKEEDPMVADLIGEWQVIAQSLIDGTENKEEEIEALGEKSRAIGQLHSTNKGEIDVHATIALFQAGINQDLISFASKNLSKDQVERLQELTQQPPADFKERATAILLETPGAGGVLNLAIGTAEAVETATEKK